MTPRREFRAAIGTDWRAAGDYRTTGQIQADDGMKPDPRCLMFFRAVLVGLAALIPFHGAFFPLRPWPCSARCD